jgi:hypothetical protein
MTQETKPHCETEPGSCRCDGTGAYTVSIPIANAVVSIQRECPVHGQPPQPVRQLALDTSTRRVGEVMQEPASRSYWQQYSLRPAGGGREWTVKPRNVRLLDDADLEDR